jgi:hypothetical protein
MDGEETVKTSKVKPSVVLALNGDLIRKTVASFRATNPRVFGSTLHGTDREGSDLDILVDIFPGMTLFDLGGLQDELECRLGIPVHLLIPGDLPLKFREKVLMEARPI